MRMLSLGAMLLGLFALPGCDDAKAQVSVKQPIEFSHGKHLRHFSSGAHRDEMIKMHLSLLEVEEVPPALKQGNCVKCHAQPEELTRCAGCHVPMLDKSLRERTDIRACVGCHRQAYNGRSASIPSNVVCACCHGDKPKTGSAEEQRLNEYLKTGEDIPWVQLHRTSPSVDFPHGAHVKYAKFSCTECHEDMTVLEKPPTTVRVYSMTACLKCHQKYQATGDCIACHK